MPSRDNRILPFVATISRLAIASIGEVVALVNVAGISALVNPMQVGVDKQDDTVLSSRRRKYQMNEDFMNRVGQVTKRLKKDIEDLDKLIGEAEENRSKIRSQLALYEQALAVYRQVMDLPRTPSEQLPLVGALRGSIADMSAQIVEAKGGPVTVRELVDVLTAAGKFKSREKRRANYGTVFSTLQRDERFGKVPNKGEFYLAKQHEDSGRGLFSDPQS
jgi:hypothetical protein